MCSHQSKFWQSGLGIPYPISPRLLTGCLPGVLVGHPGSASWPSQRRSRWVPVFSRPCLLKSLMVAPPKGLRASPSLTCHTVTASTTLCGRSRYCRTQHVVISCSAGSACVFGKLSKQAQAVLICCHCLWLAQECHFCMKTTPSTAF